MHAASLIPLPLMLIPYYLRCKGGYYMSSLKLSLLAARRVDRDLAKADSYKVGYRTEDSCCLHFHPFLLLYGIQSQSCV